MYTGRLLNFDLLMKNGKFGGSIEKKKYIINTVVSVTGGDTLYIGFTLFYKIIV